MSRCAMSIKQLKIEVKLQCIRGECMNKEGVSICSLRTSVNTGKEGGEELIFFLI